MDYDKLMDIWEKHGVCDKLKEEYKADIENSFHWDNIHEELDMQNEEYRLDPFDEESNCYGIFVTTVLSLMPSGKFYMPFACSNVTMKEAAKDEIFNEALEEILENQGLFAQAGEGDPCDIFFCKIID